MPRPSKVPWVVRRDTYHIWFYDEKCFLTSVLTMWIVFFRSWLNFTICTLPGPLPQIWTSNLDSDVPIAVISHLPLTAVTEKPLEQEEARAAERRWLGTDRQEVIFSSAIKWRAEENAILMSSESSATLDLRRACDLCLLQEGIVKLEICTVGWADTPCPSLNGRGWANLWIRGNGVA